VGGRARRLSLWRRPCSARHMLAGEHWLKVRIPDFQPVLASEHGFGRFRLKAGRTLRGRAAVRLSSRTLQEIESPRRHSIGGHAVRADPIDT
jgi:hypothetical protein